MQIPKCKYLGVRVLESIRKLGSTCSISSEGIQAGDWLPCPFLYVNVWKVTGCPASHVYLCFWLLQDEAVETLGASEAALVSACGCGECCRSEFHLNCPCQTYLVLFDQLVVQEILPVLFQRLAIADPFKAKQESQGALEILDEPPCYKLYTSVLYLSLV